ncbi:hypothetical protein HaLaN_27814 [Haematococcus lacustris]|uniref:Uncharacterized protein n=1 Tax=Haematococcus lacustris TaxID=44745 RepID=A0A6A0A8Z2_HAELA|nr:hypothetical protein HaLaN_27814 [Haematococcus lacustris]
MSSCFSCRASGGAAAQQVSRPSRSPGRVRAAAGSEGGVGQEVGGSTRGRHQQRRRQSCRAAAGHQAALKLAGSKAEDNTVAL